MAENDYREYKEEKGIISTGAAAERTLRADSVVRRRFVARRPRPLRNSSIATPEDYLALKATMTAIAQDITQEVRDQHVRTRAALHDQHHETRDEIQNTRRDLLDAIKSSPAQCLKLVSEFGSLFLIFSLLIRFALRIELVNPAFALFMLVAFALYWGMAQLKQSRQKSQR
jgi:hypothetical protein